MRKLLLFFAMLCVSVGTWAAITISPIQGNDAVYIGGTQYSGYGIYGAKAGELAQLLNGTYTGTVNWNGASLDDLKSAVYVKVGSSSAPNILNNDDLEALELLSDAKFLDIDGSTLASGADITKIKAGSAIEAVTLPNGLPKAKVNAAGAALTACNENFGSCISLNAEMVEQQLTTYTYTDPCSSEEIEYTGEVTDGKGYIDNITRPLTDAGSTFTYTNTKFRNELSYGLESEVSDGKIVPNPLKVELTKLATPKTSYKMNYNGQTITVPDHAVDTNTMTVRYDFYCSDINGNTSGATGATVTAVTVEYTYTMRNWQSEETKDFTGTPSGDETNGYYAMVENVYTGQFGYQFDVTSNYNYTYTDPTDNCNEKTVSYTDGPHETIDVAYNQQVDLTATTQTINVPKEGGDCDVIAYVNTPGSLYKATSLDKNDVKSSTGVVISGNITLDDISATPTGADPMPGTGDAFNPPVTPTRYETTTSTPALYLDNAAVAYKSIDLEDAHIDNPVYLRIVSANMDMERIVFPKDLTEIPTACCYANGTSGNYKLKEAVMPEGLRSIGDYAFHGTAIEDVFIRNTTYYVGYEAFGTSKVKNVTFEKGLTDLSFSGYVFDSCMDLKHVVLPEGVLNIGNYIFNMCKNLDAIRLPSTLVTLGDGAFHECTSLRSLTIPEGVRRIGKQALSLCYIEDLYLMSQTIEDIPAIYSAGSDGMYGNSSFARNQLDGNGTGIAENYDEYLTKTSEEMLALYREFSFGNTLTNLHYNENLKDFIDYNPYYYQDGIDQSKEDPYLSNTYLFVDSEGNTWPSKDSNHWTSSGQIDQRGDGTYTGDYARCFEAGDPTAAINADSPYKTTSLDEPSKLGWRQFVLKKGVSPESHEVLIKEYKDIWYTMCFPWHLTDEQLESAFASNFCIAEFTGVKVTEDDGQYTLQLCFDEVAKAQKITDSSYPSMIYSEDGERDPGYLAVAGHPYMIHPATGTNADEPAVRCYLTDLHPLDYSLETNANYTAQAQKIQKNAMIEEGGEWVPFTDNNDQNDVYTFIGNISNDPVLSPTLVGDYTIYNSGTEEEPNYYKYVPENAYFLAVKKSESNYPRYFREVRSEEKRENGNKAGKWSLYSAVVYPDGNALATGGLEKLIDGATAGAKGFDIDMFDFKGMADVNTTETTEIEKIVDEAKANNVPVRYMNVVFSINGQVISKDSKDLQNLPKGVYIVNGKKYFVK